MKSLRLSELQIEYFRGATNRVAISFDTTKPLVVVFGENGTGKSTLVDALDLIANDSIGSLEQRSSSNKKYAPAIGKKQSDVKVTLFRGSESWKGTIKSTNPQVSPAANRPLVDILRRPQLLRLVEAQPAKRYEVLQHFIDVDGVEKSEKELADALKLANQDIETANRNRLSAEEQLSSLWDSNGRPGTAWREWAKSRAELNTDELAAALAASEKLITACDSYLTRRKDFDAAMAKLLESETFLASVSAERNALKVEWESQTPQLINTLTATTKLLDAGWIRESCPVCQQAIAPAELRSRISTALEAMKTLTTLHEREQVAERNVNAARQVVASEKTRLLTAIRDFVNAFRSTTESSVSALGLNWNQMDALAASDSVSDSNWSILIADCERLAGVRGLLSAIREEQLRDKNQLQTIKSLVKQHIESISDSQNADAIRKKMAETLDIVRNSRIEFIQTILDSVSQEAGRLYQIIHPKEETSSGRLALDPTKRASLLQHVDFAGHVDVEPQGYFSDSHLDTLGFCYWLALAKRVSPDKKVLVLDDVFTSVDAAHLSRIIELLDSECDHFAQIFVFTHNRTWRDRYRFNQAAGNKAHMLELSRWTPSRGVSHGKTQVELAELIDLLEQFSSGESHVDRQELASRCGILLEALLSHLSQHYQCKVPHKPDGDYTLGDLISGCQTLMKILVVEKVAESKKAGDASEPQPPKALKDAFAKLCEIAFIRNQVGCHFNLAGAEIADSDVEQFGEATVFFAKLIVCEHCGEVPRSDKSTHRQCSCKRTRLLPAKM